MLFIVLTIVFLTSTVPNLDVDLFHITVIFVR